MTNRLHKGWCPGALRPMAAKDGLLVRLRFTGGTLTASVAQEVADLASRFGSGLFDLSARGNLQMRGVTEATLAPLQDGLRRIDLIDDDAEAEAVRNVLVSPLAGLLGGIDVRPLASELEQRLTDETGLHALPGKFGFLIDDGSRPSLAAIESDLRFDWLPGPKRFSIGVGGTRHDALRIGSCAADDLPDVAARIASRAVALFARTPDAHRLRHLRRAVAADGPEADALATALGGTPSAPLPNETAMTPADVVGDHTFAGSGRSGDLPCLGLAAPFGCLTAKMLIAAAELAAPTHVGELRLTPWRVILVPGASAATSPPDGFVTEPADPRLAVAACIGFQGCVSATTSTRRDAEALAYLIAPKGGGITLHVSGCSKGCALPSAAPMTLVARNGRYDLIQQGRANDPPVRLDLDLRAAGTAILELS